MTLPRRLAAVITALAVVVLPACSDDDVAEDEARLTVSGVVTLTPAGAAERIIYSGRDIAFGDIVRVDEGTASIELANGDIYEMRAGHGGAEPTQIEVGATPRLLAGEVLLSDGFPTPLQVGDVTVTARGATRVSADVPAITSFVGDAQVEGFGGATAVPALRTQILEADTAVRPLQIDISDPWDRRYLGEAYSLGERLEALSLGYTSDLQSSTDLSAEFFATVLPELGREPDFTDDLVVPARPAGETLVGAVIALTATEGTFRERWESVFGFRDQGASWGLVALAHDVRSTPVVDSIELALGASPLSDDPPPPPPTTAPTSVPDEPDAPDPVDVPPPSTSPPETTTPPPPPPPTTEPGSGGILGEVLEPVTDLLDEMLDVLGLGSGGGD